MTTEKYIFKKGEKTHLDCIYEIQGLAGGKWWEHETIINKDSGIKDDESTEINDNIYITRDIEITVTHN